MFENTSKVLDDLIDEDYLTRHLFSPLIMYESVSSSATRSANIKNFTLFEEDLANNALPQWMFITPNMSK